MPCFHPSGPWLLDHLSWLGQPSLKTVTSARLTEAAPLFTEVGEIFSKLYQHN